MGAGVLQIRKPSGIETFEWNGDPGERQTAREAFETLMRTGQYMASVTDTPNRSTQVRTFREVEQVEQERGFVEAVISPALVGG